jgi:hypothetical protein
VGVILSLQAETGQEFGSYQPTSERRQLSPEQDAIRL